MRVWQLRVRTEAKITQTRLLLTSNKGADPGVIRCGGLSASFPWSHKSGVETEVRIRKVLNCRFKSFPVDDKAEGAQFETVSRVEIAVPNQDTVHIGAVG